MFENFKNRVIENSNFCEKIIHTYGKLVERVDSEAQAIFYKIRREEGLLENDEVLRKLVQSNNFKNAIRWYEGLGDSRWLGFISTKYLSNAFEHAQELYDGASARA